MPSAPSVSISKVSKANSTRSLIQDDGVLGHRYSVSDDQIQSHEPTLFYGHPHGELWMGDSIRWLRTLESDSVDLLFADPPYNIKKAEWDTFESQQHYIDWSMQWIEQAARVLKPAGTLYVCGFSEILADLKHPATQFFKGCKWLIWHYKNKANLGNDWGRSHESILHLRKSNKFTFNIDLIRIPYGNHTLKYPVHPQAVTSQYSNNGKSKHDSWQPHPDGAKPRDVFEIPTISNSAEEKTPHITQKPEELLRRIVLASSNEGDLVVDPFLGSGTTAVVSEQLGRKWLGNDISPEYLNWTIKRVENVKRMTPKQWVAYDYEMAKRRNKIR